MKNLLKRLALWLVKITGIDLIEPYTLQHLKHMIHNLTDNYDEFKYSPFFIELTGIKPINPKLNIEIYIPLLIDCENVKDAVKLGRNFSDWLVEDKKYGSYFTPKNISKYFKSNPDDLVNDEKQIINFDFKKRIDDAIQKTKRSQYYLIVDLLENYKSIEHSKTPIVSTASGFENLVILIEDKEIIDILDNQNKENL